MTTNEKINRNIGLSFDFLREIIKDPKLLSSIPDGSNIEFVEKDFSIKENIKIKKVKYYKVKSVFESVSD